MKSFFTGRKIKIFLHLLAWAIFLGLPLYFIQKRQGGNNFLYLFYISTIIGGIIFYVNYLILVPIFFFHKKRYTYVISVIILLVFFYFISTSSNDIVLRSFSGNNKNIEIIKSLGEERLPVPPPPGLLFGRPLFKQVHLINFGFSSLFLVFFSLGLRILERYSQTEKLQKELEKEKLNSELAFLKNQISPHFFFNTLNNIYSLIGINVEDSRKAVLTLSKLMRYLLYESEQGNPRLSSEIMFMKNYIDLMKLRMSDKISLKVSFPDTFEDINIPPLLFIPFIENAFKYGISYRETSLIDISMQIVDNSINFRCANNIVNTGEESKINNSGIGLENVNKRLNLLFPDKHVLKINETDLLYEILLCINIK